MSYYDFTDNPQLDGLALRFGVPINSNAADISDYVPEHISATALIGGFATAQAGVTFEEEIINLDDFLAMILRVSNITSFDNEVLQPWYDDSEQFDKLFRTCNIKESNRDAVSDFFKRNRSYLPLFLESIDKIGPLFGEEVQITLRYIDDSYEAIKALFCVIVTSLDADAAYDLLVKFEEEWLEKQIYDFQDNVIYTLGYQ